MVKLAISEKYGVGSSPGEYPVKNYTVGPHVPEGTIVRRSSARPASAQQARPPSSQQQQDQPKEGSQQQRPASTRPAQAPPAAKERPYTPTPAYLDERGHWVKDELPEAPLPHLTQMLSATSRVLDLTVSTAAGEVRSYRPVVAIHSYTDTSPLLTTEFVNGDDGRMLRKQTARKEGGFATSHPQTRRPGTAPATRSAGFGATGGGSSAATQELQLRPGTASSAVAAPFASIRNGPASIQLYWKHEPLIFGGAHVSASDLDRLSDKQEELGKNAVPGSAQAKLIGGKWKNAPRPVQGDVVFTDYYGPVGGGLRQRDYYGRSYSLSTQSFSKNKLVEDPAYIRVQANMTGIHTLRNREGYCLEGKIMHAANPESLIRAAATAVGSSPVAAAAAGADLHSIKTYHRIK